MNAIPSTPTARNQVIQRLGEDLVGPHQPDEVISARPSDIYLTGILWPRNTELPPEEDERLAIASAGDETSDDAEDQALPAAITMRRPSTAGLSFAVFAGAGIVPKVQVRVRFGLYSQEESQNNVASWRRHQLDVSVLLDLSFGNQDFPLTETGVRGVRLNARVASAEIGQIATVTLVNGAIAAEPGRDAIEALTLFQVGLEITACTGTELVARPSRRKSVDDDDRSGALLYRFAQEFAAGHTCSADWKSREVDGQTIVDVVATTWLPEAITPAVSAAGHQVFSPLAEGDDSPLSATFLAHGDSDHVLAGLESLCTAYEGWIALQRVSAEMLFDEMALTAQRHLNEANTVLRRMREGVSRLRRDPAALKAFRLSNCAMALQQAWSGRPPLRWRPFQLGFLLLTAESAIDGTHPDRAIMDLLWFPTGGGKTESYLGLIALVAFHRRLSRPEPDSGAGVAAIMRYTLRLLTTQQFQRGAAMIMACEAIRRGKVSDVDAGGLGTVPFSIGLWVGDGATPNTRANAFASQTDNALSSPRQLSLCPCCGGKLDYGQLSAAAPVLVKCPASGCELADAPLPVWTVDEDVYSARPTLLIGTVDKFAQIVRKAQTSHLFGVGSGAQPQLILQDELHLISGPLGTIAGLYETALDLILSADGARPKIIGSTATIRRAAEQVRALFDRDTCQFPPPGLDAADSGFAVTDIDAPGRCFVGVSTAGRSAKFSLQAVAASLLQTAVGGLSPEVCDPYYSLVAYFNSLRELGGAIVLMQDDVNDTVRLIANSRGETPRQPRAVEELTSRRTQTEILDMLNRMATRANTPGVLDVVLATNMLSVGIDIPRLGLMLVNGQPKTMAEYIQATSRVGRGMIAGLVVPLLNHAKPRDRSHFETFRTWHSSLYRNVEATSVTPFASRARDRALHAVLVALIRHLGPGMLNTPVLTAEAETRARLLIDLIVDRAQRIDPLETSVRAELESRLLRWKRRAPVDYWRYRHPATSLLQGAEEAAAKRAAGRSIGQAWPTPNTMRGVEPSSPFRLTEHLK